MIVCSKYKTGLPQLQWIAGLCDRWEFEPFYKTLTVSLQSPNVKQIPTISAIQGDCKRVCYFLVHLCTLFAILVTIIFIDCVASIWLSGEVPLKDTGESNLYQTKQRKNDDDVTKWNRFFH